MKMALKYGLLAAAGLVAIGGGSWFVNGPSLQTSEADDVVWQGTSIPESLSIAQAFGSVHDKTLWGLSKKQEKALEKARQEQESTQNTLLDEAVAEALRKGHYQLVGITQSEQVMSAHLLLDDGEVLTVTLGDTVGDKEQVDQIGDQSIRLSQNDTQTLLELYPMALAESEDE